MVGLYHVQPNKNSHTYKHRSWREVIVCDTRFTQGMGF
jgi:hypothetical protein